MEYGQLEYKNLLHVSLSPASALGATLAAAFALLSAARASAKAFALSGQGYVAWGSVYCTKVIHHPKGLFIPPIPPIKMILWDGNSHH